MLDEATDLKATISQALPPEIRERLRQAGLALTLNSASFAELHGGSAGDVVIDADELAEMELLEEMGSYEKRDTGIDNVVYISPRGRTRHAARIKVAIDPPDSFNPGPGTKQASIAIHDGSVTGEQVPPGLYQQLRDFIDLNRQTLLDYWDYRISTTTMEEQLRPVSPKSR
jgi:hypothetical protein